MSKFWVTLSGWFDSQVAISDLDEHSREIDWLRCTPFVLLHVACLGAIWVGFSTTALIVAVALYFIRVFAITAFYHRYSSHRSFKTSRWLQFIFAVIGASSIQRGPLWWAAHHRHHHRHHHRVSDLREDSHSPVQHGFLWSHMLWFCCQSNFRTKTELIRDFNDFPELRLIDRFDILIPVALGTLLFLMGETLNSFFPQLGTSGLQLLVWGLISTVVLFHTTVATNSIGHLFGKRRYPTKDFSRNNLWMALLTLGEGWHNNHHYYPASVQQGFHWWEIDITYLILVLMSKLGLVWNLRLVPEKVKKAAGK
ncbi:MULTISPECIES: acyl-CoA desaturase [unclassified Nitrospina]|uniref:acyl-CoA desaturase n=1 Tax=unclassified Nitrospina TaxID=2638683 RepID=UPI003F94B264